MKQKQNISITYLSESLSNGNNHKLVKRAAKFTRVSWLPSLADTSAKLL